MTRCGCGCGKACHPPVPARSYYSGSHARAATGSSGDGCCFRRLARGERRLAARLAQRWVKLQLGALAANPA